MAQGGGARGPLSAQLMLLLPSALLLLGLFSTPRLLQSLHPRAATDPSSAFSAALSLKFPAAIATDDTLTAGAEALNALLDPQAAQGASALAQGPSAQGPGAGAQEPGGAAGDPLAEGAAGGAGAGAEGATERAGAAEERGEGSGDAEGEVVKAAVVDVDMQGLSAAEAEERRSREQQLSRQVSHCSCYAVKNDYCCTQVLCVCGPLCWTGRELVGVVPRLSEPVACRDPAAAARLGEVQVDGDILKPLKCGQLLPDKISPLAAALEEGGFRSLGRRDLNWMAHRRRTALWRLDGATFLRQLDVRAASDAAAFAGGLFPLLLLNNATGGALAAPAVRHVVLPRDRFFRAVAEEHGPEGLLAHTLELLLRAALEPLGLGSGGFVLPEWHRLRVVQDEKAPEEEELLGGGGRGAPGGARKHVEFERAWEAASEAAPLCMQQVVLAGRLKGLAYPNNSAQAQRFQAQALAFLGLQPEPPPTGAGQVRVLFMRRADVSDRVLEAASEQRLMGIFRELAFARIEVLDIQLGVGGGTPLALAQVVHAVQNADVVVGLHGSALVHAGAFLREGTVVLEIVPHHLFFTDVQVLVAASGGLFLQHMLLPSPAPPPGPSASRGPSSSSGSGANSSSGSSDKDTIDFREWDAEYAKHTVAHCMNSRLNFQCRQYFMRDRPIVLSPGDEEDLTGLLGLAKHFAETVAQQGLAGAREELARQALSVCKSGFMDLGFTATDWLFDPSAKNPSCILKRTTWGTGGGAPRGSQGSPAWLLPLALGTLLGVLLDWQLLHRHDLHGRILRGIGSLSRDGREAYEGSVPAWSASLQQQQQQQQQQQGNRQQQRNAKYQQGQRQEGGMGTQGHGQGGGGDGSTREGAPGMPLLNSQSPLVDALARHAHELDVALQQMRAQAEAASALGEPLHQRALEHLGLQRFYLEAERVTAVDSGTARSLRQSLWPNTYVASMPWRTANLSRLLPAYRARGLVPDASTLVQQCLETYQQAQALEDEHQRVLQEAQQVAYEMGRVDVMLKKMQWLDEHRDWWLGFRAMATRDYGVNLLEHTMDGVRKIYWRLPEKERWTLTKWLSCYLPYAREWETGWPQHQDVVARATGLMDRLGVALARYVEADWKFKELDWKLLDQCSLTLPNKNWTAIHDRALEDLQLAARLSGSAVGRCAELSRVQEQLTLRPVMEAPQRMWKKDPELYSPEDRPRFSFLLQYRGSPERVKPLVERLYRCTEGMLGRGELQGGLKSEMYVNMMDPWRTMWPWILSWVRTDKGKFVVPVLPQLVPDSSGLNDLGLMARGDLLVVLPGDALPPDSCRWLQNASDAFAAWPHLGLLGYNTGDPFSEGASSVGVEGQGEGLRANLGAQVARRWHTMEASIPAGGGAGGGFLDPRTRLGMHFTGALRRGPLVLRRSAFTFLGGMDELDDRQAGAGATLADFRLSLRVWLSGHQVAKLDVDRKSAPEFFRGRGAAEAQRAQGEGGDGGGGGKGGGGYDSYDAFLATYADAVEAEVGRLNGLLESGDTGSTQ